MHHIHMVKGLINILYKGGRDRLAISPHCFVRELDALHYPGFLLSGLW